MARPLRIRFENAYYHVTCRGHSGQEIFLNDADRSAFLDRLERSREPRHRCQVLNCELKGEWSQVKDKDFYPKHASQRLTAGERKAPAPAECEPDFPDQ